MSGIYFVKLLFQLYIRMFMYIYICIRFMIKYYYRHQNSLKTINLGFIHSFQNLKFLSRIREALPHNRNSQGPL